MLFKEIVGQGATKKKLIKSVTDNRVAHAQMFTGPEGTGKLALAIAYSQYINCENKSETDSCGVCKSCHKYQKLIHPDLHFVFPVNETKKKEGEDEGKEKDSSPKGCDMFIDQWRENILKNPYITESQWYNSIGLDKKQGIINVSESSNIIRKLSYKSYESEYKTMIIWLPERMHHSTANKLLKLIEEPPDKTLFLLISENPGMIISTIQSRTQIVKVPPVSREEIAKALVDRFGLNPGIAQDICRTANGNFQMAQQLVNTTEENPNFENFRVFMRHCYKKDVVKLLEWVEEIATYNRERLKEFFEYSLKLIRESFMLNLGLEDLVYVAGEEADFCKKFSPFVNGGNVLALYHEVNSAHEHISRNGNTKIVLTDFALKVIKLINNQK